MVNKDSFQKYLDAGVAFTNLTRARAEELVAELVKSGEFQSSDAKAKVDELIERSRRGSELLMAQVRHEVTRQLDAAGITNLEDLAKQVSALIGRTAATGRAATQGSKKAGGTKTAAKKAPATKAKATATKKPAAKKAAAKKSPAKKAAGKQAAATKASAKKSAAKTAAKKSTPGAGSAG
jgi:polyhydroxyalkanoate synthesis regulator phasin